MSFIYFYMYIYNGYILSISYIVINKKKIGIFIVKENIMALKVLSFLYKYISNCTTELYEYNIVIIFYIISIRIV